MVKNLPAKAGFNPWSGKSPTGGTTQPVHHDYWAHAPTAWALQQEMLVRRDGEEPRSAQLEKAYMQQPRPSAAKSILIFKKERKEVLITQLCLTLCNRVDCSLPGSSVHGVLQTQILEWIAIPFSRGSSWPGIEPSSPTLQANSLLSEPPESDHFLKCSFKKKRREESLKGKGAVACTRLV